MKAKELHDLMREAQVLANTTAKTFTDDATRQRTRMVVRLMSARMQAAASTKTIINQLCHRLETAKSAEDVALFDFEQGISHA